MHDVFCQTVTQSCQITNNILQIILTKYCQNSATFFSLNDYFNNRPNTNWVCTYLGKIRNIKVGGRPPRNESGGPRPMRPPRFRHLCRVPNIFLKKIWYNHKFYVPNKRNTFSGHRSYLCRVEIVIFQAIKNILF